MQHNAFKELSKDIKGKILFHVPLSRYTSLRVGGPADIMIYPSNTVELQKVIRFAHAHSIAYFTIGKGSNLLIRDGGLRGIVIKLSRGFKVIKITETVKKRIKLLVGSGVSLKRLLAFSIET